MMRKRYFLSGMMAVVSLALGPILARPSAAAELSGKTVKIGAIYSVSGVCAEWGTAAKIAGEIAVEEINAAGGIGGVPIEVIWYDLD